MAKTLEDTLKKIALSAVLKGTESAFESTWASLFEDKTSQEFKPNHSLEKKEVKKRLKGLLKAMPNRITGKWKEDTLKAIVLQDLVISKMEISVDIAIEEKSIKATLYLTCIQDLAKEEIQTGLKKLLKEILR